MDKLTDRLAAKMAVELDFLMTIDLGPCDNEDVPYWAIRNAIGFERSPDGSLLMLATDGDWYRHHVAPHRSARQFTTSGTFGRLAIVYRPDVSTWMIVGEERDFNPHFWEPSVIPKSR